MPVAPSDPARVPPSLEAGRRRRRVVGGGALVIAIAFAAWNLAGRGPSFEPSYQGRPLGYWLSVLGNDQSADGGEAPRAIRTMGTNALPGILRELQAQDPGWKQSLSDWINELPGKRVWLRTATHRRDSSVAAFRELGALGTPALPELIQLFSRKPIAFGAAEATAAIGPSSIPGLTSGLRDPDPAIRAMSARTLGWLARESQDPFEPLATALNDAHWEVRYYAVEGLGYLKDPATAELLRERFTDECRAVRVAASNVWTLLQSQNGRWQGRRLHGGGRVYVFEPAPKQGETPGFRE